jgi:hypothetical protein
MQMYRHTDTWNYFYAENDEPKWRGAVGIDFLKLPEKLIKFKEAGQMANSTDDYLQNKQMKSTEGDDTRLNLQSTGMRGSSEGSGSFSTTYLIGATVILVVVLAYLVYGLFSLQESQKTLRAEVQQVLQKLQTDLDLLKTGHKTTLQNINDLRSDTDVIGQKVGVAENVLREARSTQEQLRQRQAQDVAKLQDSISQKADTNEVKAIQQQSEKKFGEIDQNVGAVRTDVEQTKKNLDDTNRQLVDVRDTLSSQIAHNRSELEQLKRKGERTFFEFSLGRKQGITAVGDIKLLLKKTDVGKQKYEMTIFVDDQKLEKKNIPANEPIQFLVGKDRVRYEVVVNSVGKDKIDGYLAVPKDKALSAEKTKE